MAKSENEALTLLSLGENTKNSMLLTLIIPFGFMLFMSVSMNRVWSLYLMLQITCNLMNLKLSRPSNAEYIMYISENISSFKMAEEENVKWFMKNYVFRNLVFMYELLIAQGTFISAMIMISVLLIIYAIIYKTLGKDSIIVTKIKQKVIWSSVFRSQIQFYFPVSLVVF